MADSREKPLISFVMVTFNQQQFIRDAVAGAFSQTYSPLEIVLSDDCSPDRTFAIMQEMAAAYQGPHAIILNRNEKNMGVCGNFNRAVELSHGELIVGAGGDDISLSHRCARIAEEWNKPGRKWHSICSDAEIIDEAGQRRGICIYSKGPCSMTSVDAVIDTGVVGVAGCSHAFSRANYETFGPLPPEAPGEDEILGFRSLVHGGILWIPDVLLLYRRHNGNLYKDSGDLKGMSRQARIKAVKEDLTACELRYRLFCKYLRLAAESGILSREQSEKYVQGLEYRYPCDEYRFICKYSFLSAVTWLAWQVFRGRYRRGMFTLFKCHHLPFGIRSTLRRWRAMLGVGNR